MKTLGLFVWVDYGWGGKIMSLLILDLPKLGAKYEKSPKSTVPLESKSAHVELGVRISLTSLPKTGAKNEKSPKSMLLLSS